MKKRRKKEKNADRSQTKLNATPFETNKSHKKISLKSIRSSF